MRTFWALVGGFAICGATTNGLIGIHFIPSAHDHGMPETTAAGLLAVVGIFDIAGTIASGYLTDRVNPRLLLAIYYGFRGVGLLMLPALLSSIVHPSIVLVRRRLRPRLGGDRAADGRVVPRGVRRRPGTIVFGWVFASHQIGAAHRGLRRRVDPRHDGHLHDRVVRRRRPLRGRCGDVGDDPASTTDAPAAPGQRRGARGRRTRVTRPGSSSARVRWMGLSRLACDWSRTT